MICFHVFLEAKDLFSKSQRKQKQTTLSCFYKEMKKGGVFHQWKWCVH